MIYNFENLSFQILTVDSFRHKKGVFNVKARPFAAFSYRVSGTGSFEIGAKRFVTKPGDVLFLPADTPYKVEYSVSESIVVHFEHCNYFEVENICFESSAKIKHAFEQLLKAWKTERSINQSKSIIYDILDKIANEQKELINDETIANCVRYMAEHYSNPRLDVETLCGISFMSVSSLQRAFTKHFAMSPKQYLIQLRMDHALELLTKRELSIKEISFACGFTDEKYFSRAFKKIYGYPPTQLRNI